MRRPAIHLIRINFGQLATGVIALKDIFKNEKNHFRPAIICDPQACDCPMA